MSEQPTGGVPDPLSELWRVLGVVYASPEVSAKATEKLAALLTDLLGWPLDRAQAFSEFLRDREVPWEEKERAVDRVKRQLEEAAVQRTIDELDASEEVKQKLRRRFAERSPTIGPEEFLKGEALDEMEAATSPAEKKQVLKRLARRLRKLKERPEK